MSLAPGSRLGPYEVLAPLGAGGMGEVYRARDTRLNRTVALKIVNPDWSDTEEGRRRFQREARLVSQINHPHVCALYDVGRAGDREFLVMEFVEGETLGARLARGPLPLGDLIRLGQALAGGLEAAHRRGVVHRDLKPTNVLLSKHGPKILDFGLAGTLTDAPVDLAETHAFDTSAGGTILGTLPYMAPEQMQGTAVDARADVFALGAVLYEMATGHRAFDAPSQAGVIAAVIGSEPEPVSARRAGLPPALDRLIGQCLAKDREERPQTAGEVARALMLVGDTAPQQALVTAPPTTAGSRRTIWGERVAWLVLAVALAALLVVARLPSTTDRGPARPLIRFDLPVPEGTLPVVVDTAPTLATSPDGRHVVFSLTTGEVTQLWLHAFDSMQARPLRGTEGARGPFWSPGSRHVAFFAGGALKRVSIESDAVDRICPVSALLAVGSWGVEGTILFADDNDALMRVAAGGGTPELVLSTAGKGVIWPHFLPDGRRFLAGSPSGVFIGALDSRELTPVVDVPTAATYSPSGHLLYVRESVLVAQPFSLTSGRVAGEPRVLAEGLQYFAPTGGASFSASHTGVVVYRRADIVPRRLVWIGRDGHELGAAAPEAPWVFSPRISPDERHLAVAQQVPSSGSTDLWVYELPTGTPVRLTADVEVDNWPAWWPDGRSLVFSRNMDRRQPPTVARKALTDVAAPARLVPGTGAIQYLPDVAPDARVVAFGQGGDIWVWRVGDPAPEPLVQTPFAEGAPAFSPDGRWLAYDSNVSGRTEVYLRPFGRPGDPVRVSSAGGSAPRWRADGQEIFFLDLEGRIMGARVMPGASSPQPAPVTVAPTGHVIEAFDASRDGQRFVALLSAPRAPRSSFAVIVDWETLLK